MFLWLNDPPNLNIQAFQGYGYLCFYIWVVLFEVVALHYGPCFETMRFKWILDDSDQEERTI